MPRLNRIAIIVLALTLLIAGFATVVDAAGDPAPSATAPARTDTVILSDATDPYYPLAEEMARTEQIPIAPSLDDALGHDPSFLLWVVSPSRLSDQALIQLSLQLQNRSSAPSVGIITGGTMDSARNLWLRAATAKGTTAIAVNASNSAAHIEGQISRVNGSTVESAALDLNSLVEALRAADYLTFTGHGAARYLRLDEEVTLSQDALPDLPGTVVATGSCNTLRPWQEDSIALAFVDHGATAYAGFAYSPNEGYLIGEFTGLPFRGSWPEFPIGHMIQVQNHGTLQGFAAFPYYFLLGDPRIALNSASPYAVLSDEVEGESRILSYGDVPAGLVPIRVNDGARYSWVEVVGNTTASMGDPFYNSRLQLADIKGDKYILVDHREGTLTLRLQPTPPLGWGVLDVLTDSLDHTLLYAQQSDGDLISLGLSIVGLIVAGWLAWRRRTSLRTVILAAAVGLIFALLYAGYAFVRFENITITSKTVEFSMLATLATFLLTGCAAFWCMNTRSKKAGVASVVLATSPALATALFGLGMIAALNLVAMRPTLGTDLWNYSLGWQCLGALAVELVLITPVFVVLRRYAQSAETTQS